MTTHEQGFNSPRLIFGDLRRGRWRRRWHGRDRRSLGTYTSKIGTVVEGRVRLCNLAGLILESRASKKRSAVMGHASAELPEKFPGPRRTLSGARI